MFDEQAAANGGTISIDFEQRRARDHRGGEYQLARVRRASDSYGRRFAVIFDDAARGLAHADLRPLSFRLLFLCLADLNFDRWQRVPLAEWADELGVTKGAISKAIAQLHGIGVLERQGRDEYRLAPALGWRGTPAAYHAAVRDRAPEADSDG